MGYWIPSCRGAACGSLNLAREPRVVLLAHSGRQPAQDDSQVEGLLVGLRANDRQIIAPPGASSFGLRSGSRGSNGIVE